jgi:cytochrome c-type biogenesis protein CcmH/NrfF
MDTSGQTFWLLLLTLGVVVLGAAIVFGIMRNRQRTLSERVTTEVATKREYAREDRDAS